MKQPSRELSHTAPDILIVGGGIIGLSIALELDARGARVTVLERDTLLRHASSAAAGMLALHDPHNPPELFPLARYSARLYPRYLERLHELSGAAVPLQTATAIQHHADGSSETFYEFSLDPRQLAEALRLALRATRIQVHEQTELLSITKRGCTQQATLRDGSSIIAPTLVLTTGPWGSLHALQHLNLRPRKGQMLRVQLPRTLEGLREVHRNEEVYIVPRTTGPQAGSALIGATIEDAGFDLSTHAQDLDRLRQHAAKLVLALGSHTEAPQLEAWAGLRPATPDELPVLGEITPGGPIAALGHYRNGILLAPATAQVIADLIERKPPLVDLTPFAANRFSPQTAPSHT